MYKESPETPYDVSGYGSGTANWTNTCRFWYVSMYDMYDIQLQTYKYRKISARGAVSFTCLKSQVKTVPSFGTCCISK